ncbi:hypothetical protein CDAR_210501 [Caerostris darwini]|uniref:Uncharacterized protein n=1 Tax=Caerostris darwini TaxID=1538125 RepID=A0AAV4MK01_9ARAC|nr:hypothetical protein CDAR_210501 [Caerostris darwini]
MLPDKYKDVSYRKEQSVFGPRHSKSPAPAIQPKDCATSDTSPSALIENEIVLKIPPVENLMREGRRRMGKYLPNNDVQVPKRLTIINLRSKY